MRAYFSLLLVFFLSSCSSFEPVFNNNSDGDSLPLISVSGDENYSYIFKKSLERELFGISDRLKFYKIKVSLEDNKKSSIFTQTEVLKEQKKITAHVLITDSKGIEHSTTVDSSYNYEISDLMPMSSVFSEKNISEKMTQELARSVSSWVIAITR